MIEGETTMPDPCDFCSCDDVDEGTHELGCPNADADAGADAGIRNAIERLTTWADEHANENGHCYALITDLMLYGDVWTQCPSYQMYLDDYYPDSLMALYPDHSMRPSAEEWSMIYDLLDVAFNDEFQRDSITNLAMTLSICPIHFCDWAICFDDEDPDCAQVRHIFPHSHDT